MFEEALGIYRAVEDRHGVAMGSTNLAMVQYEQGDLLAAKKLTIEALKLGHEIDDKHGVPYLLATLGEIQKEQGKFVEARKNEEEAESMRREMGEDELEAESLLDLALLALEEKRFREAATGAQKAAEALHKSNALDMEAYAYAVQAQGFLAQKKVEEAHEAVRRSVALSNKAVIFNIRLPLTILLARLRLALNGYSELDTATRTLQGVLAEAARHGFLGYQLDAGLALGEIELKASASHSQGSARLATVEREARAKGFTLIASKAAAMRTHA
jgi:tetratricopeptide (TPR) repeat protein